jgi:hypothetical protein
MNRFYLSLIAAITLCMHSAWAEEHLNLDKTTILGNGELPKVTFVVPWRDAPSTIPESKLSPAERPHPAPLDQELYQRQIEYLRQLKHRREHAAVR